MPLSLNSIKNNVNYVYFLHFITFIICIETRYVIHVKTIKHTNKKKKYNNDLENNAYDNPKKEKNINKPIMQTYVSHNYVFILCTIFFLLHTITQVTEGTKQYINCIMQIKMLIISIIYANVSYFSCIL